jgi:predicted Zn finger-like uncharacterized protein
MIVECPNCKSSFNLDDALVPPGGRKVRCSVCENIFTATPPAGPPTGELPELDELADGFGQDFGADDDDLLTSLGEAALDRDDQDFPGVAEAPEAKAAPSASRSAGSAPKLDLNLDTVPKAGKAAKAGRGRGRRVVIAVAAIVLLLAAGLGAVWQFAPQYLGLAPEAKSGSGGTEPVADPTEQVRKISLEGIKQYYVENDKTGRLFVIQGKAVNLFETPRELIAVEASLFDAQNQTLATRRLLCGNTLDLFQLQVLAREEIDAALENEAGIGANNISLQTGQSVPFMIVFFTPPEGLAEFNVRVVDAKEVAP